MNVCPPVPIQGAGGHATLEGTNMENKLKEWEPRFVWTNFNKTIYGKIGLGNGWRNLTFRFSTYKGWIGGVDVYDSFNPSEGWINVVSCQHFEEGSENYFESFVNNKCNNDAAMVLLKQHLDFIYFGRAPVGV